MAHLTWRSWLVAGMLGVVAVSSSAAHAQEDPSANTVGVDGDAAPAVACVRVALRVGAAEVNGVRQRCEDTVTHHVTITVTFNTPPTDGAPATYTPLAEDQGSDAAVTPDPQP
jgi:hypothetical protein